MPGSRPDPSVPRADARAERLTAYLRKEATALGFCELAITGADADPDVRTRLEQFVALERHGSMDWLADTLDRRVDPQTLWPDVRSVIMLAMNYGPDTDPLSNLDRKSNASVSVYARNRDYHDIVKGRLKQLASKLVSRAGGDVKVFVDTAPVMEKPLAQSAGLGWIGKHTNLVSRRHGSWLFLGSIFTTVNLIPDAPDTDHCGSCRACLDACPTGAFPAPYQIDARRCISYLTIENKGPVPHQFRRAMGNRIYGCDDCLAACPWNKYAHAAREAKLVARDDLVSPPLTDFLAMDDPAFRAFFSGSPVKRIGRDRFLRNVLVAAGNSADPALVAACEALIDDAAPLVRGAAVWAVSQLTDAAHMARLAARAGEDADADVRAEWRRALCADHQTAQP
ncbi:tRNA epoxyqueuosine(34) reductase QueG [Hoeflea sp. YIM 152468]|uniref:tRNA epoxyqueuosine(34) reductase QueG n=1 Tax=Hoeflea sp. YIM 152468 TaxID=3031759 RepID=UPI0023DC2324|nr:tRNA epoxyqueuosine(34) reductase QueG [Hoeflea sp. YIM 152468]MDF1610417.1 tRNA epoxyqueuosine(34) reductase QueG [Hoeflea sp. YIM 152468]